MHGIKPLRRHIILLISLAANDADGRLQTITAARWIQVGLLGRSSNDILTADALVCQFVHIRYTVALKTIVGDDDFDYLRQSALIWITRFIQYSSDFNSPKKLRQIR